ncbi:MAG: hypothetical protein WBN16_01670 [Lutimonas sp.]|jgi:hypothetical protein
MKTNIITIVILLISIAGFSQDKGKVTKYVTTFPNGEEAITIVDNSNSNVLNLSSAESFYKYEILAPANHELIHGSSNEGKVCDIDKTKLSDGTYTLKVYTDDFVITSDITINNSLEESVIIGI